MGNQNITSDNSAVLREKIDAYFKVHQDNNHFMGSVLVDWGGQALFSQGYGMANLEHDVPNLPSTKFRLGSVTKQFTATAILKLQEQNLLDISKSLSTYLPDYPNGEAITIHQLLNHTSGIPNYTSFEDLRSKKRNTIKLDELIAYFCDRPLDFTPGERFNYSNSGYAVLTKIIETASDLSYADYLDKYIFEPLEMFNSGYDYAYLILPSRASGYSFNGEEYQNVDFFDTSLASGAGALYSTIEDLSKWSRSLYTDAVLSQASKDAMFTPSIEEQEGEYYGYGWKIDTKNGRDRVSHNGGIEGFVAHFAQYPREQISIIVLSNLQTSPILKIEQDLAAIIFGEPYEFPIMRQVIEIDPAIYENYVGQYKFAPSKSLPPAASKLVFTVTTNSQRIFTQLTGEDPIEIFPESSTKFFLKVVDAQLTFVASDEGLVSRIILHQNGRDRILNKI